MPLEIIQFELGELENNTYLMADPLSNKAVVIDPGFDSQVVASEARKRGWEIQAIWLTHAHFDHIAGIIDILSISNNSLPIGLHPDDLSLLKQGGGASLFGFHLKPSPEPTLWFTHGQVIFVGGYSISVRHTPGHTAGHVVFYSLESSLVLCGDLIFYHGIGRTDLLGGNHATLLRSIREQILSLPDETRLLSGHGPESTVAEERDNNPFLE